MTSLNDPLFKCHKMTIRFLDAVIPSDLRLWVLNMRIELYYSRREISHSHSSPSARFGRSFELKRNDSPSMSIDHEAKVLHMYSK